METTTKPVIEIAAYPEMPPIAALLSKARAYLSEPEHWVKGRVSDGQGGVCALGALNYEGGGMPPKETRDWAAAGALLAKAKPERFSGWVADYNNLPSTTHADILALFDRAIAAALAAGK